MARIYGRVPINANDPNGPKRWVKVETAANGSNDAVNILWLIQVLKGNLNESPFFGDWGLPAKQSVQQQIAPDLYIAMTQQRFAPLFAALIVAKQNVPTPTYNISVVTHQGTVITQQVPV